MKHPAVSFVLLLSSLTLAAQNGAQNGGQAPANGALLAYLGEPGNGCPIGMVASQGVWDHTIKVRQGQQEKTLQPFGQRIFLTLGDSHTAPIVAATVKVYGLNGKNHMVRADGNTKDDGEATQIMEITFTANQKGNVTGDLYIPGFTAVNSIELLQVSYNDGKIWRIGASGVCRVTPDPMMLIANH
jgi:hypothetical protein